MKALKMFSHSINNNKNLEKEKDSKEVISQMLMMFHKFHKCQLWIC